MSNEFYSDKFPYGSKVRHITEEIDGEVVFFDPRDQTLLIVECDNKWHDVCFFDLNNNLINHINQFNHRHPIDTKYFYLNRKAAWFGSHALSLVDVPPTLQAAQPIQDGHACVRCRTFSPMATSNVARGGFACYGCRSTHKWWLKEHGWIE